MDNSVNVDGNYQVCNLHFLQSELEFINGKLTLNSAAIPSIFERNTLNNDVVVQTK